MSGLFLFSDSVREDPEVEAWMQELKPAFSEVARRWFGVMKRCGEDVRELLHDGHPTACVGEAAFVYVNAFKAHVNVGFFRGAELADPARLLEGSGKLMRNVKIKPDATLNSAALEALIQSAYVQMKRRVRT